MYTTEEIAKIVGKSSGAIRLMVSRSHWSPARRGHGRGSDHAWNESDAVNVGLFFSLVDSGLSQDAAGIFLNGAGLNLGRAALKSYKDRQPCVLFAFLMLDGTWWTPRPLSAGKEILENDAGWTKAVCINLWQLVEKIKTALV